MASSVEISAKRGGRALLPPVLALAGQRARKTWSLLLLTELGMLGAVLLACVVPLYTSVTLTASLRYTLNSQSSDIIVNTTPRLISSSIISQAGHAINSEMQRTLGNGLEPVQFSIQSQPLQMLTSNARGVLQEAGTDLNLISEDMQRAAGHLHLVSGHLPDPASSVLEIALTPETARTLHAGVGGLLHVHIDFTDVYTTIYPAYLDLRISGLFTLNRQDNAFWHDSDFAPSHQQGTHFYALLPNETLLNTLNQLSSAASARHHVLAAAPTVNWFYHVNTSHLTIDDLNGFFSGIQQVQFDNANNPTLAQDPYLVQTQTLLTLPDTLNNLVQRTTIIEFPVISLMAMILGLMLFFLVMTIQLLIESQNEAIALLQGRGASLGQILIALVLQGIIMAALALLAGLLLAPLVVSGLTWQIFAGRDQGALQSVLNNPGQILQLAGPYALLAMAVALATLIVAVWAAARRDILAQRRETARSTRLPLWQRLRLDLMAIVIALAGYGASLYLLNSNALDNQTYLLLLSPLALLQTLFLMLAVLLLIFRFYPQILRLGARAAERRRGAAPVLALAQIARAPRKPMSMTMLLALTSAFAIFALIFTATQTQRVQDVASYQAGADFSGSIPNPSASLQDLSPLTQRYSQLPGVLAASAGFIHPAQARSLRDLTFTFQAVDTSTFAQAATWSAQDSSQPLASLMQQIRAQGSAAGTQKVVPAIVDSNTWNVLHLAPGATFVLTLPDVKDTLPFTLRAVAEVQHIPSSNDSALPGILVDYTTFVNIYAGQGIAFGGSGIALNAIWLSTRDDARTLASVRDALKNSALRLNPVYDRRAIEAQLRADPIYLTLIGELELGALTALLLALLGCLVSSWLNTRARMTNFMALRALGATPRQVIATLSWEQGIIYTAALLLGILTGALLAALSLPSLILTSVLPQQAASNTTGSASFYAAQFIPPLQVIIPLSLWLILAALVLICLLTLSLMVSRIARSSLSMVLRLSED